MEKESGLLREFSEEDLKAINAMAPEDRHKGSLKPITEEEVAELTPLEPAARKGRMRNKPCPCGSGVKFKRCCW